MTVIARGRGRLAEIEHVGITVRPDAAHRVQAALRAPLPRRGRVLIASSGAAATALVQHLAGAHARRQRVSIEAFLAAKYGGMSLSAGQYGEHVVTLLTDPRYAVGVAYGSKSDSGITPLDRQSGSPP